MYATSVIESSIAKYEQAAGHKLIRIERSRTEEWIAHLDARLAKFDGDQAELTRNLTHEERLFIRNERVMSMLDFGYWSTRYGTIERDGGGICKFTNPWGSQRMLLTLLAKIEQDMHEQIARGEATAQLIVDQPLPSVNGILIAAHKGGRQLGLTAVGRLLTMHRATLQNNRRSLNASVNDDKIKILYDRDKLIYDNLPFWLRPKLKYDEKCAHMHFDGSGSQILYQVSSQKSGVDTAGIGVGRQIDDHHLTEVSTWVNAEALELDFMPTIPRSLTTFGLWESTAHGRGGLWHRFTEKVRRGLHPRFSYLFIPVYAEESKYRSVVPVNWQPDEVALLYASKVYDTSPEFMGRNVLVSREHLYWWSTEREAHRKDNRLHIFLTNYAATPEESFQHSGNPPFPADFLDEIRLRIRPGTPYDIDRVSSRA